MLIQDFRMIGNRLLAIRKRAGLTQAEVAELAGLADRTNARPEACRDVGDMIRGHSEGMVTRGTTTPNRLRRVDRWIATVHSTLLVRPPSQYMCKC